LDDSAKASGVVLCQQFKTIDYKYKGVKFIEKASTQFVNDALARIKAIVS
jgi:mRNA interferase MazF